MSEVPSIKGSVMAGHIQTLMGLRHGGKITRQDLEGALSSDTLALLDQPVQASAWYVCTINRLDSGGMLPLPLNSNLTWYTWTHERGRCEGSGGAKIA
jgi:hypothetical protein